MNILKRICFSILPLSLLFSGCSNTEQENSIEDTTEETQTSDMFTNRDLKSDVDLAECETILCQSTTIETKADGVSLENNKLTISKEGMYALQGTLDGIQIVVSCDENEKVQLVLNNLTMTTTGSAIYVEDADKVFITTYSDSQNYIYSTNEYEVIDEKNIDGAIYSKSDLTCNGQGSLVIQSDAHGIVSKDDLVLTSGNYEITSQKQGLAGKDSIRIADGSYVIQSQTDGLKSETDESEKGFVYIENGNINITSQQDCISATNYVQIVDGNFTFVSGNGIDSSTQNHGQDQFWGYQNTEQEDTVSQKGIKSDSSIQIEGGNFSMTCSDDAIHAGGDVIIDSGQISIDTGDDGIHSDQQLTINDGTININQSYEGLEGFGIDINGGTINISASDDGMNAAGGNDGSGMGMEQNPMQGDDQYVLTIDGGTVYIYAQGDGIDSNGQIIINGGSVWVDGPSDSGNSAIDYGTSATVNGGTLVAIGSSGMVEDFDAASTQGIITIETGTQQAGSYVALVDANGETILSGNAAKSFDCIIFSTSNIQAGSSYTIQAGDFNQTITMDSSIYSDVQGMGFGGSQPGGGFQPGGGPQAPGW